MVVGAGCPGRRRDGPSTHDRFRLTTADHRHWRRHRSCGKPGGSRRANNTARQNRDRGNDEREGPAGSRGDQARRFLNGRRYCHRGPGERLAARLAPSSVRRIRQHDREFQRSRSGKAARGVGEPGWRESHPASDPRSVSLPHGMVCPWGAPIRPPSLLPPQTT